MEKIVERNQLFDFYGELLTEHQKEIYRDAIYEDMSLSELSEQYGVTRQGIHDLMKRCDKTLAEYEQKLHLIEKFLSIKEIVSEIEAENKKEQPNRAKIQEMAESVINQL